MELMAGLWIDLPTEHQGQATFDAAVTVTLLAQALAGQRFMKVPNTNLFATKAKKGKIQAPFLPREDHPFIVASQVDSGLLLDSSAYRSFTAECLRLAHGPYEISLLIAIGQDEDAFGETGARLEPVALKQLIREVSWAPPDVIRWSQEEFDTLTNRIKAVVEEYFGQRWD